MRGNAAAGTVQPQPHVGHLVLQTALAPPETLDEKGQGRDDHEGQQHDDTRAHPALGALFLGLEQLVVQGERVALETGGHLLDADVGGGLGDGILIAVQPLLQFVSPPVIAFPPVIFRHDSGTRTVLIRHDVTKRIRGDKAVHRSHVALLQGYLHADGTQIVEAFLIAGGLERRVHVEQGGGLVQTVGLYVRAGQVHVGEMALQTFRQVVFLQDGTEPAKMPDDVLIALLLVQEDGIIDEEVDAVSQRHAVAQGVGLPVLMSGRLHVACLRVERAHHTVNWGGHRRRRMERVGQVKSVVQPSRGLRYAAGHEVIVADVGALPRQEGQAAALLQGVVAIDEKRYDTVGRSACPLHARGLELPGERLAPLQARRGLLGVADVAYHAVGKDFGGVMAGEEIILAQQ